VPNLLADTGIWYALYDVADQHHAAARERVGLFEWHNVIVPWPVLYEVLRTKLVRNSGALTLFEAHLRAIKWVPLDDTPYRQEALNLCFQSALRRKRPLSLVDCALRLMLEDRNIKVDSFMTFNVGDFHDVCQRRKIPII
jgi:predicted nucleic acid-binding protein